MEVSNKNASSSAFGWQFQVEAGIYLMLLELPRYLELNIEGFEEDIEIKTKEGTYILAQAKSSVRYDEPVDNAERNRYSKRAKNHLKEALNGLMKSSKSFVQGGEEVCKLVYITNIEKPFGLKCNRPWSGPEIRAYNELREQEKSVLQTILGNVETDFSKKLYFYSLPFEVCNDYGTRHACVLRQIRELFRALEIENCREEDYLNKVHELCSYSLTSASVKCTNEDFVWLAIITTLEFSDTGFQKLFPKEDEFKTVLRIKKRYAEIINSLTGRFTVTNSVLRKFDTFVSNAESMTSRLYDFMEEEHGILDEFIDNEMESNERIALKKYIIHQIVQSKYYINLANSKFLSCNEN